MWTCVVAKHDSNWLRLGERPLAEALAEKLNDIEKDGGPITNIVKVTDTDNLIELVVQIEPQDYQANVQKQDTYAAA